ncbi:MAG: indole-3-glycerol phosphate synthase TrpC [Chitinophagales bacterium]|nr:indole-3-glycerol phosphate synthase TrpC [Chitinophagales bacterium]
MTILDTIVKRKKIEVAEAKTTISIEELKAMPFFRRKTISMSARIKAGGSTGIIAEFKRHSPSKKWINKNADPVKVVQAYEKAGAVASSVLTDKDFFKGSLEDLKRVRENVNLSLLRKDFMIDEYQFYEAKAHGADAVLLIAAILTPKEVKTFTDLAHELGLEVLLELHCEEEMGHVYENIDMVGINNRDLRTFEVDVERSAKMANELNVKYVKIAESGIESPKTISYFRGVGFDGFLIGENFMKSDNPGLACENFIKSI